MTGGITPLAEWARKNARIRNEYFTHSLAEFIGTLILCLFAVASSCQNALMHETYMMPVFGGVFGLMIAVTATGGLSGGHINPAVSFALALSGNLNWAKVPFFWVSQLFGAYVGAGLGYGLYKDQLKLEYGNLTSQPAFSGLFSIYPGSHETGFLGTGFADQIVSTSILVIAIFSAFDPRNMVIPKWFFGPFFALVVAGITFTLGYNTGAVMNPARDLGPRFMAITLGWDSNEVFMFRDTSDGVWRHYWLIPLFGPMVGSFVGTMIYIFLIGSHLPDTKEEKEQELNNNVANDWTANPIIPKAIVPEIRNYSPARNYDRLNQQYFNNGYKNGVRNPTFVQNNN